MGDEPTAKAHRPDRDKRVRDAGRFLRDRETEAVAMIRTAGNRSPRTSSPTGGRSWHACGGRPGEIGRLEDER